MDSPGEKEALKALEKACNTGIFSKDDADVVVEFLLYKSSVQDVGEVRKRSVLTHLIAFKRHHPAGFRDTTLRSLLQAVQSYKDGDHAAWTKKITLTSIKMFYLWMIEEKYLNLDEKKIRQIKLPKPPAQSHRPDDLLTEDDIKQIVSAAKNSRDRAFFMLLYESGCRIGELAALTWKDCQFDRQAGVKLYIKDEKEKTTRYVRLLMTTPYLATLKADCKNTDPADPVFQTNTSDGHARPLLYQNARNLVFRTVKRAGIQKKVTPHLFRHSRITHLVNSGLQESVIKKMMWNNLDTQMFKTYVSLSEGDIDNALAEKAGISIKKKTQSLEPKECPFCGELNGPTHQFCSYCGKPITSEARARAEEVLAYARKTPEYQEIEQMIARLIQNQSGLVQ